MKTGETESFKNDCLEKFMNLAESIDQKIQSSTFFDYVDPSSGLLMKSQNSNVVYNELQGATHFLGYANK